MRRSDIFHGIYIFRYNVKFQLKNVSRVSQVFFFFLLIYFFLYELSIPLALPCHSFVQRTLGRRILTECLVLSSSIRMIKGPRNCKWRDEEKCREREREKWEANNKREIRERERERERENLERASQTVERNGNEVTSRSRLASIDPARCHTTAQRRSTIKGQLGVLHLL